MECFDTTLLLGFIFMSNIVFCGIGFMAGVYAND
jgi:hypothetical protein